MGPVVGIVKIRLLVDWARTRSHSKIYLLVRRPKKYHPALWSKPRQCSYQTTSYHLGWEQVLGTSPYLEESFEIGLAFLSTAQCSALLRSLPLLTFIALTSLEHSDRHWQVLPC